jgi:hypothetical protein
LFFFLPSFLSAFFFFPLSNFLVQTNPISNPKKSFFFFWVFRFQFFSLFIFFFLYPSSLIFLYFTLWLVSSSQTLFF